MIHVVPENIPLQISTTSMEISYSELEGFSIDLTVKIPTESSQEPQYHFPRSQNSNA